MIKFAILIQKISLKFSIKIEREKPGDTWNKSFPL